MLQLPGLVYEQCAQLLAATVGTVLLAAVGAFDDMRSLRAAPRLAIQCVAVGAIIAAASCGFADPAASTAMARAQPPVCWWSMVRQPRQFMVGIDWMTVAEFVPAAGAIVLLGMARSTFRPRCRP